jgi:hypothetical protein
MQLPDIHINGSDPATLRDEYIAALEKVQDALRTLEKVGINARDYYRIDGASAIAFREHGARCKALHDVAHDLAAIAEHIDAHC